jgi:Kef-type K+ transport system membrane component KefB
VGYGNDQFAYFQHDCCGVSVNGVDVKNVPGIVWVCATVTIVAIIGSFVILGVTGADATEFRSFLNTIMNAATVLLSGGAFVFAGASAKQTNGVLDDKIRAALAEVKDSSATNAGNVSDAYAKGVSDGRPTV